MNVVPTIVRGPILNPREDGGVDFIADGILAGDEAGKLTFVGDASKFPNAADARSSTGIICPPFLDCHIHIPQHPIRGKFLDGVGEKTANGRLIAGLERNVFPAESRCSVDMYAVANIKEFHYDTLAHGVVGGSAYMTVHAAATRLALQILPPQWFVGLVLMNQNCPEYLRTDEANFARDAENLAKDFGERFVMTDRFAVAVNSPLRQRAVELSKDFGLRMQTHLNEQIGEKAFVEEILYPRNKNYTDVYLRDGLLDRRPILAHCIRMSEEEFDVVAARKTAIAHCPTSNTLLGSGVMPLDKILDRKIDYAICTDVGASPTTSILCEMVQFLKVHTGRSDRATPQEALFRTTFAAAKILGIEDQLGRFAVGRPMSFIEIAAPQASFDGKSADKVIMESVLEVSSDDLQTHRKAFDELEKSGLGAGATSDELSRDFDRTADNLDKKIQSVTLNGKRVWSRE